MLAKLRAQFPFGVLLITDEKSTEPIPDWSSDDQQVTSGGTAMVVKIRHEVDGPATVRVWDDDPHKAGPAAVERELTVKSGALRVSTATGDHAVRIPVPAGTVRVKVVASAPRNPGEIDLVVIPGKTERQYSRIPTPEPTAG
jgi:hypothetical protein